VLFRTQGKITPALEIPKPYVLALDAEDGDLLVQLTLFGFASDWTEMAAEALLRALRGPLSIGRSLEVGERRIWSEEGLAPFEANALSLQFETPLQIRQQGRTAVPDLPMLISNLGNRISGLARWQDATVEADWRALKAHAGEIALTAFDRESRDWQRFSRRQGRQIPMQGRLPRWLIEGDLAPILPLLQIGTTTHAGSHAALGMGRFSLEVVG
jgi:hypothetical protein